MKLLHHTARLQLTEPSCVAIGNFDGVHLGHQALLRHVRAKSRALGLTSVICTFEPLPEQFFARPLQRLINLRTKVHLLGRHSLDRLLIIPFKQAFSEISPQNFIHDFLLKQLNTAYMITGRDFRFGRQRQGTVMDLVAAQQQGLFDYETIDDYLHGEQRVSSTLIRSLVSKREFSQISTYLGHPFCLYARVIKGQGLGKTRLGTATANLNLKKFTPPLRGVFACRARINDEDSYPAVANLGMRPTVNGTEFVAETHLLNFDDDILNTILRLDFIAPLRAEKKFSSLAELKRQIDIDKETAWKLLKEA